jgi:hypothetical protein
VQGELSYRGFTIAEQTGDKRLSDVEFIAEGPDDGEGPLHIVCMSLTGLIAGIDELLGATDGATTAQAVEDRTPKWMKAWIAEGCVGRVMIPNSDISELFGYTSKGIKRMSRTVAKPLAVMCTLFAIWPVVSDCDAPGLVDIGITASGIL